MSLALLGGIEQWWLQSPGSVKDCSLEKPLEPSIGLSLSM